MRERYLTYRDGHPFMRSMMRLLLSLQVSVGLIYCRCVLDVNIHLPRRFPSPQRGLSSRQNQSRQRATKIYMMTLIIKQ